jgi:hypothetical protein
VRLLADDSASDAKWSLPQRQLPATQKWIFASHLESSTALITSDVAHLTIECAVATRRWAALAALDMYSYVCDRLRTLQANRVWDRLVADQLIGHCPMLVPYAGTNFP